MELSSDRIYVARTARPSAQVGVPAGVAAGIAYLLIQVGALMVSGGMGLDAFRDIAAVLLGAALPPLGSWRTQAVGVGILIHLLLAACCGQAVDVIVMRCYTFGRAALLGGLVGICLYVVNSLVVGPDLFAWFGEPGSMVVAACHILFGVVAALLCITLRRYLASRGRL